VLVQVREVTEPDFSSFDWSREWGRVNVIEGIAKANLVVADLTAANPNVFYELGIAHSLEIPTVLITQSMETVPFDLRPYRCHQYSTHFQDAPALRETLRTIATEHQQGTVRFGSPVADHLPKSLPEQEQVEESAEGGQGGHEQPNATADAEEGVDAPVAVEEEESGFIDFALEGEASGAEIARVVEKLTSGLSQLAVRTQTHTGEFEALGDGRAKGSAVKASQITQSVARDMTEYAILVKDRLPKLESAAESFFGSSTSYVEWLSSDPDGSAAALASLRGSAEGLLEATNTAISGIRSYREAVVKLREMRISRAVGRAAGLLTHATDQLIGSFERIEALSSRLLVDIDAIPVRG